jgi:phytoene dehydrogenase-like protein
MLTVTIIGSGPNGLSAAIVLASAGIGTTVLERNSLIGGAVRQSIQRCRVFK